MDDRLVSLRPFGATAEPGPIVRASLQRAGGRLSLRYVLAGPAAQATLPSRGPEQRRADGLWQHTCLEAFLAPAGSAAYWELNLSPSGDWNAYRFDAYRAGMRPEPRAMPPSVDVERASCGTVTVRAAIDLMAVSELAPAALDVGLAAVLEAADGTLSYWSVAHHGSRPDFHRRDSFVIRLVAGA